MIADILSKEQRQEGFGILRVVGNMAWLVGPTVGGFVARTSFFALFVIDASISCIVAVLFYLFMERNEARSARAARRGGISRDVPQLPSRARDRPFVAFVVAAVLMGMVYIQMYNSLSVYLRDNHGIEPQGYGFLLTSSAITVICFQIWTMRVIKTRPQFLMMAFGTLFYLVGFGMFGMVSTYWLFVAAVVIITIGEMIVMPTSQAIAAGFARMDMRGRYMAAVRPVDQRAGGRGAGCGRAGPRQLPPEPSVAPQRADLCGFGDQLLRASCAARRREPVRAGTGARRRHTFRDGLMLRVFLVIVLALAPLAGAQTGSACPGASRAWPSGRRIAISVPARRCASSCIRCRARCSRKA